MRKYMTRHVMLGLLAFALALLSLLSLCFAVVRIDFASAQASYGGGSSLIESFLSASTAESGFDLLSGNSKILVIFQEFSELYHYRFTPDPPPDFSALAVFSQVCDIVLLVASLFACITAACWFFLWKDEKAVKSIAIVIAVLSVIYLVQGLVVSLVLETEWQQLLKEESGSSLQFYGKLFDTLAYVPFILVMLFEAAFWLVCCKWKEKKAVSRERNAAATGEEEGASSRQDAQMQLFERLRMLKQLCDEGVLTEQEFEEMKAKLLGSGE